MGFQAASCMLEMLGRRQLTDRDAVGNRLEAVLLQNTYLNIVEDELQKLGDDDGPGRAGIEEANIAPVHACLQDQ